MHSVLNQRPFCNIYKDPITEKNTIFLKRRVQLQHKLITFSEIGRKVKSGKGMKRRKKEKNTVLLLFMQIFISSLMGRNGFRRGRKLEEREREKTRERTKKFSRMLMMLIH